MSGTQKNSADGEPLQQGNIKQGQYGQTNFKDEAAQTRNSVQRHVLKGTLLCFTEHICVRKNKQDDYELLV